MIDTVIKRNANEVPFNSEKIKIAIEKAFLETGRYDKHIIDLVVDNVLDEINSIKANKILVEKIQDIIEDTLMGIDKTVAKSFILYREKRRIVRESKNEIFKQMDEIVNMTSEDIRDNANKSGDKLTTLRAMFSDIVCKEYAKQITVPDYVQAEQEKLIYEHDRNYRNIPFSNCFSGDTEFITNYGVIKFNDCFDGQEVEVIDKNGKWRKATVRNYGKQDLYKITLQCGRTVKEIKATSNHRWVLKDGSITTNLKIGDRLHLLTETELDELNDEMFCLGFILGDGHDYIVNDRKTEGVRVRLCGEKISYLNKFIKSGYKISKQKFNNNDVEVYKNGFAFKNNFIENKMWKILSKKDKVSLFIGYYSADGFKDRNGIATSNKKLAEMIKEISALAGYHITSEKHEIRDTNYKENAELYTFRFMKSQPLNRNWIVKNIKKFNGQKYEVWCVEEPITKTFTLNNGVVTGNCCLVNYRDMLENGFHVGQTHIHNIKSITTAIAILSQIIAHVSSGQYGGVTLQRLDEGLEPYIKMSYDKHLKIAIEEGIEDAKGYAWRRLEKETFDACQGLEYEINTLTNSRGEVPFITLTFGLGTSKFAQMFQMQYLKNRQRGFDGITPVFPKLCFITKAGLNLYPNDPQYYIYKEALKTSSMRLYPDYLNYDKVSEVTGGCFKSPMGEIRLPM